MLQHVGEEIDNRQKCTARPCCHHKIACRVSAATPNRSLTLNLQMRQRMEESIDYLREAA